MTRFKVEVTLRKEKEKAYASMTRLDLKPPYPAQIAVTPYPIEYVDPNPEFRWQKRK